VTDEDPGGREVMIWGVADAYLTTAADGTFSTTVSAYGLGSIYAMATDAWYQSSNVAEVTLTSAAPTITLSLSYGAGNLVTLSGRVTDEDPGGREVMIWGVADAYLTTAADGTFSVTVESYGPGAIYAMTTDAWGQWSDTAEVVAASSAPAIVDLVVVEGADGVWTFRGRVTDESPEGLTIYFGGLSSLEGQSVTAGECGWFEFSVQLQEGEEGTATLWAMDWYGQQSETTEHYVLQTL
jgi:hypothetical protein